MVNRIFICLLVMIAYCHSLADTIPKNFYFKHFSIEDGLSQVTQYALLKDQYGFVWIGSLNGLNRFDGEEFLVFKNDKNDSTTICGNSIITLYQDTKGRIWIGTQNNGICFFDYRTGVFQKVELDNGGEKVNDGLVVKFAEDDLGSLWIATYNYGLQRLALDDLSFEAKKITVASQDEIKVKSVFKTQDDRLWVSINDKIYSTLVSDKISEFKFEQLPTSKLDTDIRGFAENEVAIYGASNQGLWRYDKATKTDEKINLNELTNPNGGDGFNLYEVMFDEEENLWVGSGSSQGLFILYDQDELTGRFKKVKHYPSQGEQKHDLKAAAIYSFLNYTNECKIIGGSHTMNMTTTSPHFDNISADTETKKLNYNEVFGILENQFGLWVGTSGKGLNLLHEEGDFYYTHSDSENSLVNDIVFCLESTHSNALWIGTGNGISIIDQNSFNPQRPKFINIQSKESEISGLSSNTILHFFEDSKNQLWVGTQDGGLNRFTGDLSQKKYTFQTFKHDNHSTVGLPSNSVLSINESENGDLWIGTRGGLTQMSFNNNNYVNPIMFTFKHDELDSNSILDNTIYDIHIDGDNIWLATRGGLNVLNSKTGEINGFTESDGLPNNIIFFLQPDDFGNLWLGTGLGLSCFNMTNHRFVNYTVDDGIQSNEYNLNSRFKSDNGELYLGGIKGIDVFNPELFLKEKKKKRTPLIFTKLVFPASLKDAQKSLSNDEVVKLNQPVHELSVSHNDLPFQVYFAGLEESLIEKKSYQYRFDNNHWINLGSQNFISFVSLGKGQHNLQVRASLSEGEYSKPVQLSLRVIPPFFKSNFAFLLYVLSFLGFIFYLYKSHLNRQLEQKEALRIKEIDTLKSSLYTNITHEFRTPITVILGMANRAVDYFDGKEKAQFENSIEMVKRNGNALLDLVNQMLDLAKLDEGKLVVNHKQADVVAYLKYLIESFHSLGETKQIRIHQHHEIDKLMMDFDSEKIRQVINNLMANAIKFSDSNHDIHVKTWRKDNHFHIIIRDEGIGINEEDLPHIFDRFYQSVDIAFNGGSGIGLAYTKELIELMGGGISIESEGGKGAQASIFLPISNRAELATDMELDDQRTYDAIQKPQESFSLSKIQILVIEDNVEVAFYIGSCLQRDYNVHYAENGQAGVKRAIELIPDLIISDVMMPEMDGYEVSATLKTEILTNHIPIILLTAKADQESIIDGLRTGADAYLTKPFNETELKVRVKKLIEGRDALQKKYSKNNQMAAQPSVFEETLDPFIEELSKFINDNISKQDLNVETMCKEMAVSRTQLHRKLTARTGMSASKFLNKWRLTKAKELLVQEKELNISEVAYQVGYNDPAYFTRLFTNHFKQSPSKFRDN